jgi:threonylcarbamoyladenosine tRNA methylthiotransferase MtaB
VKFSVITFGCRVNQADSLGVEQELRAHGASAAPVEQADVVIVNTCSVTASADQAARQTIRRVSRVNPTARILVTGCYATRRPEELKELPQVVGIVSNDEKPQIVPILRRMPTTAERFGDGDGPCGASLLPGMAGRTAYTLRVQTGCAESCAYCIIPVTRGKPRSLPLQDVRREASRIAAAGYKEIAITGVHLGSYGRDLDVPSSLLTLLEALAADADKSGIRFRISSLEPMDCSAEIVALITGSDSFARHFHLPLQHASNAMLNSMLRPYTIEHYADLVADIRARSPEASIGSDVVVGFPGETQRAFDELVSYLSDSPLTHVHVFPYSDRPGTTACAMRPKVDAGAIRERARVVRDVSQRLSEEFHRSQIGTVHRALTVDDGSLAVTGNYLKLRIGAGHPRNEWVTVRVTSNSEGELLGG